MKTKQAPLWPSRSSRGSKRPFLGLYQEFDPLPFAKPPNNIKLPAADTVWGIGWEDSGREMCSGSKAGSHSRRIDSCITQLKAEGPSRTCNKSKEEEEEEDSGDRVAWGWTRVRWTLPGGLVGRTRRQKCAAVPRRACI